MGQLPRYLVAICELERCHGSPVPTGSVATELGRSPSTTTEMIQRLEDEGLVVYERYAGVSLTPEGERKAAELTHTFETLCTFCRDILQLEDYEAEAMRLTGSVSPVVADRLEATLLE
ncbi:metal-dependent transcriptional regulator [Halogranum rubrum]|uniref:HTH dtxR-type domain-containing protein n=1 Tax=Halogranum salarium B-1 TaxID=1210908 RepID=J2ZL52_9EURY|nr:metal-dependent transcriptional regulator [Halogranum salarium]EJN61470.1 hypothetical protein HSB1_05110 [Halogranum salarium B-1]